MGVELDNFDVLPTDPTANTAWVDPNSPTRLLPEAEGGVKTTDGGAKATGELHR